MEKVNAIIFGVATVCFALAYIFKAIARVEVIIPLIGTFVCGGLTVYSLGK